MRGFLVAAVSVCFVLGSGLPAAAHGTAFEPLDLSDLVDLIDARVASTEGGDAKVHRAWVRLARVFERPSPRGLPDDAKKLAAAGKETAKALAGDPALRALLDDALDAADEALLPVPGEAETWIDRIEKEKNRQSVAGQAIRARDAHFAARAMGPTTDRKTRSALLARAAAGFQDTWSKADRIIDHQGGPASSTFTAEPGMVYTIAGTGYGGYNGDGRDARRSSLYWVEEIKFGPDGRLYILDWNNHMLRRREPDGTLARIVGEGIPGDTEGDPLATRLNHPSGLDFAADGRIFIAAWHNHKVKVYDPTGASPTVYTVAGGPQGNTGNGGAATDARFNLVPGVLLLPAAHPLGAGDLLVTDAGNQCVRRVRIGTDPQTDVNVAGTTVATGTVERCFGTGTQGHGGDDGQALDATLGFSKAQNAESDGRMTMDLAGNVFVVSGVEHVVRRVATDGVITTVAGDGTVGSGGDGGAATGATLSFPADVAVAPDGTLFISDQANQVIRRVAPGGTITTYAGSTGVKGYSGDGGPAAAALLSRPSGLELDAAGNLFFCDKGNSVVRVIASANPGGLQIPKEPFRLPAVALGRPPSPGAPGTVATYAGTGTAAFTGDGKPALETDFYWPQDVCVDPALGLLHVVDWNNHRIRRVEDDGTVNTVVGVGELGDTNGPALEVRMNHPTDVAFSPADGDMYIATWHTDKVKRLLSASNTIAVVNKPDGKRAFSGEDGPVSLAELNLPSSVKFDASGNMYIGDAGNGRVRKVDVITQWIDTIAGTGAQGFGGDGDAAVDAIFNLPVGQTADPAGRICIDPTNQYLYVADTNNHRVRRVDLVGGDIETVAGNGTAAYAGDGEQATDASLNSPVDVDCDAAGNLYICDRDNHAVRKVTLATGVITSVAGTGTAGYSGDGGPGSAARLKAPGGIFVVRATGRVYIADTLNGVIRVVWE